MAVSTDLYHLIKSLSKSEKRYLSLNVSEDERKKNYWKIFEVIESMGDEYDENVIIERFKGQTFTKQLHTTKNYLFNSILKQLRSFRESNSIEYKVYNRVKEIKILIDKGLFKPAESMLKKVKQLAGQYSMTEMLWTIIKLEVELVLEKHQKNMVVDVAKLYEEGRDIIDLLKEENLFMEMDHKLFIHFRKGNFGKKEMLWELFKTFKDEPKFHHSADSASFYPAYLQLNMNAFYCYLNRDFEGTNQYFKKVVALWRKNDHMINLNPRKYKVCLNNYLQSSARVRNYENFEESIKEIETIPDSSFNQEGETFQMTSQLYLLYYLNTSQFKKIKAKLSEISKGLDKYEKKVNPATRKVICYNIMTFCFVTEDYKEIAQWIERILENKDKVREDIMIATYIINLIVTWELDKTGYADNVHEQTKQKLKKIRKPLKFEKCALRNLKRIINLANKQDLPLLLQKFIKELHSMPDEVKKTYAFEETELWLQARIQNRPLLQILDDK